MKETVKEKNRDSSKKGYICYGNEEFYPVGENGTYYMVAEQICNKNKWNDWKKYYGTAEDYLLHKEAFIKVEKCLDGCEEEFNYVAFSENFSEELEEFVNRIQKRYGVKEVFLEKDPKNKDNLDNLNR